MSYFKLLSQLLHSLSKLVIDRRTHHISQTCFFLNSLNHFSLRVGCTFVRVLLGIKFQIKYLYGRTRSLEFYVLHSRKITMVSWNRNFELVRNFFQNQSAQSLGKLKHWVSQKWSDKISGENSDSMVKTVCDISPHFWNWWTMVPTRVHLEILNSIFFLIRKHPLLEF